MRASLALSVAMALAVAQNAQAGPIFMGLGDTSGGGFSRAWNVSADGSTVVGYSNGPAGNLEAFSWTSSQGIVNLGDLPGGTFSSAEGVSADGSVIVGRAYSSGSTEVRAFIWRSTTGMVDLGRLPDGTFASAESVSADGLTVVGRSNSTLAQEAPYEEAFVWTSSGGMRGLGDLPGGIFFSRAWDVSADGSTVVGYSNSAAGNEAFVWNAIDGMRGLGDFPGGSFGSIAWDTSADGSVVVGGSFGAAGPEAFIWTSGGGMVGIGDVPGGAFQSYAYGVSADGSTVVGQGFTEPRYGGDPGNVAFIWDVTNGIRDLEVVLTNLGLDLSGWYLTEAWGVSADGRVIIGSGTHPSGNTEAWIAIIPEPTTALLLGIGLVGLAMRRQRATA